MKKGEKRKLDLIQIAYRLFVSRGYEHTSVDEIIEDSFVRKTLCNSSTTDNTYLYNFIPFFS